MDIAGLEDRVEDMVIADLENPVEDFDMADLAEGPQDLRNPSIGGKAKDGEELRDSTFGKSKSNLSISG